MEIARLIAFAGVGAEELAELRGLVARAGELIESPWRLGDEREADLVVVDAAHAEGLLAQARAGERGVPCVVLDAEDDPELLLARPFEIDGLMQLLVNAAPRLPRRASSVVGGADQFGFARADIVPPPPADDVSLEDFFAADLVGLIPDARTGNEVARESTASGGLVDDLLLAAAAAIPQGAIAGSSVPSARAAADAPAAAPVVAAPPVAAAAVAASPPAVQASPAPAGAGEDPGAKSAPPAPANRAAEAAPRAQYPLLDYLDGALIGLPSRIALDGVPPLVLDPVAKVFHFAGSLRQVEAYLDALLPRTQWSALLQSQLSVVRREHPGRPFDLLRWHQALRKAAPGLPPGLEPGSLYSLRQAFDLKADHPRAQRIADAMKVPRGLGEIANVSATSVVEVYAVVGAFAAIGWLEQHARQKVSPAAAPAKPVAPRGGLR